MPSLLKSNANGRVATQVCSTVVARNIPDRNILPAPYRAYGNPSKFMALMVWKSGIKPTGTSVGLEIICLCQSCE